MPLSRRELVVFAGFAVTLVAWLFRDALVRGLVLGQGDLLYQFPPWSGYAPPGWQPGNRLLLDSTTQFVPFLIHAREAILDGRFPLWSSALGAGQPFFGAFQTGVLSPFNVIGYLLPVPQALAPMAAARLLVGGVGMFVFLRGLPLGVAASMFGGIAFLLNPFSMAWLEHPHASVAAWLPWVLVTTRACIVARSGTAVVSLACVTALTLLSGHPETAFKVFLLAGAYAVFLAWHTKRPWTGLTCAGSGVLLGATISAIQLVPFVEYLSQSRILAVRADASGPLFTNPLVSLVTMIVPDFFGTPMAGRYVLDSTNYIEQTAYPGLLTWVLAAVALGARRHRGLVLCFGASALVSGLIMYGTPVASLATALIPPLQVAALSRFGLLVIASLVVVAAVGLDDITGGAERARRGWTPAMLAGGAAAAIVAVALVFVWSQRPMLEEARHMARTLRSVEAMCVMLAVSLSGLWLVVLVAPRFRGVLAGLVIAADLLIFANGLHPLRPPEDTFPPVEELARIQEDRGVFRAAGWQDALYPNSVLAYGLQDYRSYDAIGIRDYGSLLDVGFRFNGAFHALAHFATPHLLDLLNVKYVVTPRDVDAPPDRFTLLQEGESRLYRNDRVLPRAFLVDEVTLLKGDDARRAIRSGSIDLRRMVVLERDLPAGQHVERGEAGAGFATVVRYEDERVTIETHAEHARVLVLSDTYYPGWVATVDDERAETLRANYAFRAVFVPAGRHVVEFSYRPLSFRIGAGLSGLGLLAAVAVMLIGRHRRVGSEA